MTDGSKARCPNCNNLLPKFSVYHYCGACAALLPANKKGTRETDGHYFESLSKKEGGISINPSDLKHQSYPAPNTKPIFSREQDRIFRQTPSHVINKSSMADQKQPSIHNYSNTRVMMKEKRKGFDDFVHTRLIHESSSSYGNTRFIGGGNNRGECSTTSSNSYGYGKVRKGYDPLDASTTTTTTTTRIAYLEHDRAELLRKVDELNQQLSRVCDSSTTWKHNVMIPSPYPLSHTPNTYFSSELSQDPRFRSRPHENLYHQQPFVHPSCACCRKNCHVCSSQVQLNGSDFSCDMSSVRVPPSPGYNVSTLREPQIQAPWLAAVAKGKNRRLFRRPIAFGAPFITCCGCFELLELPRKTRMKEKKDGVKLRCGACSVVLMLKLRSKMLMVSVCEEVTEMEVKTVDGSCDVSNEVDENGRNVCEVQATGLQGSKQAEEQILDGVECDKRKDYYASSTTSSSSFCSPSDSSDKEESNVNDMVVPRQVSSAVDLAVKDYESPSMSTFHDCHENLGVSKEEKVKLHGERNRNTHPADQSNEVLSMAAAAVAEEEEEFSFSDYRNRDSSLDSSIEMMSNAKASPIHRLAGVFKKSFRDFAKPVPQQAKKKKKKKPNVFVNGQPIHEDTLRMAEKLAGPIHPGDYWYDFRAGFWGVMGQPCLGVIPAFIEEFNYPMPRNCAAGNTGVFVNGRELHLQDMELLSERGLPTLKHKFYTLEIDGRLYDNETGKELGGLGKLAPTVDKFKRGFGMKVPSFVESEDVI